MNRSVLIHVVLMAGLLAAAYFVWTREPSTDTTDIAIVNMRAGLDRTQYKVDDRVVTIERRKDTLSSYHWITVETWEAPLKMPEPPKKPEPPKPSTPPAKAGAEAKDKAPDKPAAKENKAKVADKKDEATKDKAAKEEPAKIKKVAQFKGSKAADELMKGLAQLSAIRSLGIVSKEKLETFGLSQSKGRLMVSSGSDKREFVLGKNTYGNMDSYLQDKQDRRVYVVRPQPIQDFPYAEFRLKDRDLLSFEPKEVERAEVLHKGKKKAMLQQNRRDSAKAFWADVAAPQKRKVLYGNWMDKLKRLNVLEYVSADKAPKDLQQELVIS